MKRDDLKEHELQCRRQFGYYLGSIVEPDNGEPRGIVVAINDTWKQGGDRSQTASVHRVVSMGHDGQVKQYPVTSLRWISS